MSREDWYRKTEWNDRVEEEFFTKLSRARTQRDQYLAIQAGMIASHRPDVALRLVETYFATRKDDFDDVRALLARAEAYRHQGDFAKAVGAYKDVLDREAEFPKHRTRTYLDLPYLIACEELSAEYDYALSLLVEGLDDLTFPLDHFMWHASKALIVSARGKNAAARAEAEKALEAVQVKVSGFRYHKDVGLVGPVHAAAIAKLRRLAN